MGVVMVKKRDEWSSKMQFVLTCVGYAVGLGNVWRFPATASEHGKSAFFIPYTICAIVVGFPVMFFEMTIGQFHQIAANRLFPKYVSFFRGLGWCMAILNTIVGITYNTVIGWCLMYTFYSIFFPMSIWTDCGNDWNDACCSTNMSSIPSDCLLNISETPSKQFFFNKILEKSHSISDFSSFNWRMAIAILVSAMGCALINVTGTKSMGKTAYVTATVPYFLIMALLGNSLFIPGGLEGIVSSLQPDFNHLTRMDTWYKAGGQISYSLSLGVANLISFSSCNSKNYNCYSDCLVVSMADFGMSLLGSLTIFSVMGILAFKNNPTGTVFAKPIAEGTSLAFVAYPEALVLMPFSRVWSIVFFVTLVLLGVGSFGSILLSFTTMIIDQWPTLGNYRQVVVFGQALFYFAGGCLFCTPAGFYYFNVMNDYGPGFAVLLVVFLELICCIHIYGTFAFAVYEQVAEPAGYTKTDYEVYPAFIQLIAWLFPLFTLAPLLIVGIWEVYEAIKCKRGLMSIWQPEYNRLNKSRIYDTSSIITPAFRTTKPDVKPMQARGDTGTENPSERILRPQSQPRQTPEKANMPNNRHIPFKSTLV